MRSACARMSIYVYVAGSVLWPCKSESSKGRMADALAHGGDEGRDKLR